MRAKGLDADRQRDAQARLKEAMSLPTDDLEALSTAALDIAMSETRKQKYRYPFIVLALAATLIPPWLVFGISGAIDPNVLSVVTLVISSVAIYGMTYGPSTEDSIKSASDTLVGMKYSKTSPCNEEGSCIESILKLTDEELDDKLSSVHIFHAPDETLKTKQEKLMLYFLNQAQLEYEGLPNDCDWDE